ncbi:serine hydrolase domain-containing protein [Actinosynnema sp. NPDC050436]|uniref:serine hydrolase domain-containing protein n=1 Tax=Actinosynnema sp. NPDC050436 TaxID=3155659 RepID=UPI003403C4C0
MSEVDRAELAALLADVAEEVGVAGAQFAVATAPDAEPVAVAYGTANPDTRSPMTATTLVQVGSTTKVYTAALAMALVDDGLADLDAPVRTHLPDLRLGDRVAERTITLRHLMSMSSGLDNGPYADTGVGDDCVRRYVDLLDGLPQHFPPGTGFGYSNASTVVTGAVVEVLTGRTWDDALRARLLDPVGLDRTATRYEELPYHRVAVGVGLVGGVPQVRRVGWCATRGMGPAGSSAAASAADVVRFGQVFLRGGRAADGTRVLSDRAVATMQQAQVDVPAKLFADRWCVGPYQRDWGGVAVYGHSGTTPNGSSLLLWVPVRGVALACLTNTADLGYPLADAMATAVLSRWCGVHRDRTGPRPVDHPVDADLYVGRYAAHGVDYAVERSATGLTVTMTGEAETVVSGLVPLGDHRFWPEDPRVSGHHPWDVAFCPDGTGRIVRLLNGAFPARRVS